MPGQRPAFRFINKPEGSEQWEEIGCAWKLASGNFTARFDVAAIERLANGAANVKLLMVENKERQPNPPANDANRSAPRRRAAGPRPA